VQEHANPLALQHGIESVQGALTGANIAKVDKKTGKLKIKKIGVTKAALRPAKTIRQAMDGAAVPSISRLTTKARQLKHIARRARSRRIHSPPLRFRLPISPAMA
jgi:hypothetical protein